VKVRSKEGVNGRGLQVVEGLSAGEWGAHLTRGRLGSWKVSGKAVWFALRIPPGCDAARFGRTEFSPWQAVNELEAMLAGRGLGGRLVRVDEPDSAMSVMSVSRDLTVWCHSGTTSFRAADGSYQRLPLADLVDAAEQIVWAHEELRAAASAGVGA
jgi:hypothetical protein